MRGSMRAPDYRTCRDALADNDEHWVEAARFAVLGDRSESIRLLETLAADGISPELAALAWSLAAQPRRGAAISSR